MAGFASVSELASAEESGNVRYSSFRKQSNQISPQGIWFDLSMASGFPSPQYYAATPLTAIALTQSGDGGLSHGGNVSPLTKHVRHIMAMTTTATPLPMPMMLLDYLMFYPFIDEGTIDEQFLENTVTLPRYTTGAGVKIMAVSVAGRTGGQSFFVNYTNQNGTAGRISSKVIQNSVSVNGSIVTSDRAIAAASGAFIPLQAGDTGVRSIQSVTMLGGDVGLFTLVLVKPLCQMQIRGVDAPVEIDPFLNFAQCPPIQDNAYLNFICCPNGSLSGTPIHGLIKTVFN